MSLAPLVTASLSDHDAYEVSSSQAAYCNGIQRLSTPSRAANPSGQPGVCRGRVRERDFTGWRCGTRQPEYRLSAASGSLLLTQIHYLLDGCLAGWQKVGVEVFFFRVFED